MTALDTIGVIGGSIAAATAANTLRERGFGGRIAIFSDEPHAVYTRPPLSKEILLGQNEPDSAELMLTGDIDVHTSMRATRLDAAARRVTFADGREMAFDGLVLATGARARSLATTPGAGEHVLRTMDDALALRDALDRADSIAVIGGGPLGMEAASAACGLGKQVTVVEPLTPMQRHVGPHLADLIRRSAERAGLTVVRPCGPARVEAGADGRARVVADDMTLTADLVLTAVGDVPNVEWLADSGLHIKGGLVVDDRMRAAPNIVAAGDMVVRHTARGPVRTPLWTSAREQAVAAADALLFGDDAPPYVERPYFWTTQFGLSIKVCGAIPAATAPTLADGSAPDSLPADSPLVLQWCERGTPVASASVNKRMPLARLRALAVPPGSTVPSGSTVPIDQPKATVS